ncbi:potassium channel family protein [Aureisphaera galaxeae]|uniref:potassium channel family protein n=1 Tax=Aureisphaera galaxeae TaxID=1538023 RepID=UPI0023505411|nr:potassium channel family protein [Aureisphaera galaxeae]MDC8003632.1 potassium channel family protein [Aureisphaera galaxeae]
MVDKLHTYRFEILLISQLTILFGELFFFGEWFEEYLSQPLFLINFLAGILLFSKHRKKITAILILLATALFAMVWEQFVDHDSAVVKAVRLFSLYLFYVILTLELILQVWQAKKVGKNVIYGLISGYISLGFVVFFVCLSIETYHPNSFQGLQSLNGKPDSSGLLYYSYITLMTIGYGDIVPSTVLARKAAIFTGMVGQFYLVILTAIIVGKYINQRNTA